MGRVRLKSKSAAFSNSSAREGLAKTSGAIPPRRDSIWGFEIGSFSFKVGALGSEIWRMGSFGVGERELVQTGTRGFVEAIIMFAMVTAFVIRMCLRLRSV